MRLKEQIENHPIIVFSTALLVGFIAGISAYAGIINIANLRIISNEKYEHLIELEKINDNRANANRIQSSDSNIVSTELPHPYSAKVKDIQNKIVPNLVFEEISFDVNADNRRVIFGKIRNAGELTIKTISLAVEWLDENGTVLESTSSYALFLEPLRAGAAKSFSLTVNNDKRFKSYKMYLSKLEYDKQ